MRNDAQQMVRRVAKAFFDAGIFSCIVLILAILLSGGFSVVVLGISLKARHIINPLMILLCLVLMRLGITLKFKDAVLLFGSLLFTLGIVEVALRIWNPPIARPHLLQIHRASPLLGWELVPGSHGIGRLRETYSINEAGFRDGDYPFAKPDSVLRIAVIGDSFTFGQGVNLDQTLVKQMEGFLRGKGIRAEAMNFGVIGYGMWQYNILLETKAILYHPDLVILCLFQDDLQASRSPHRDLSDFKGSNPFEPGGSKGFMAQFAVWNLFHNANSLLRYKYRHLEGHAYVRDIEERKRAWGPTNPTDAYYKIMSGKLEKVKCDEFSTALAYFASVAHRAGAEVLVAVVPDSVQLNDPHMQASTRFIQEICQSIQVPCIDLTPALEKEADPPSLYLFPVDAHNSPKGLKLMGEALGEKLLSIGLPAP